MTKADIITEISRSTGYEKIAVQAVIDKLMEVVKDSMSEGEKVSLRGFGTFVVKKRKAKVARNISKNTAVYIEERLMPVFKASKAFVDQLKEKGTDL